MCSKNIHWPRIALPMVRCALALNFRNNSLRNEFLAPRIFDGVASNFYFIFWSKKSSNTDEKIDIDSLKRYAVIGFCINPNILYFWYKWLDKAYVGTATKVVVKKVLMDQFLMTPPLYVVFYTAMSLMEGKEDLLEECRSKFIPTFQTSCLFWLPATTINFLFVPNTIRVAYVGTCSFVWINILCWIKRKEL